VKTGLVVSDIESRLSALRADRWLIQRLQRESKIHRSDQETEIAEQKSVKSGLI
jgi:hypothetical protein